MNSDTPDPTKRPKIKGTPRGFRRVRPRSKYGLPRAVCRAWQQRRWPLTQLLLRRGSEPIHDWVGP